MIIEINAQMQEFDIKDIGSFKAIVHLYGIVEQKRFMALLKPKVRVIVKNLSEEGDLYLSVDLE